LKEAHQVYQGSLANTCNTTSGRFGPYILTS